jgi:hypothetical protein
MFAGEQVTKLSLHVAEGDAPLRSTPLAGIEAVKNGAGGMSMVVVVAVRMAQTAPAPARSVLFCFSCARFNGSGATAWAPHGRGPEQHGGAWTCARACRAHARARR